MTMPTAATLERLIAQHSQQVLPDPPPPQPPGALPSLTGAQLAALIDHTLLKPEATEAQIRRLCSEATVHGFASICVNATWVNLGAQLVAGSPVKVCTVIGFPLGATLATVKAVEATQAIAAGAQEVDMVINVGRLKSGQLAAVYADVAGVVEAAQAAQTVVKVIIETALLTHAEKIAACVLAQQAGADFVKTSTGFSGGGATVEDVWLMRQVVGAQMGVKASGGVRTAADALALVAAGATRIGASAGVQIVQVLGNPSSAQPTPTDQGLRTKDTY
jgi:deoxyribose-phosphate aldolase